MAVLSPRALGLRDVSPLLLSSPGWPLCREPHIPGLGKVCCMKAMLAQDRSVQGAGLQEDGTDDYMAGKVKVSQSVTFGIYVKNASKSSQVQKYLVCVKIQLLILFLLTFYILLLLCVRETVGEGRCESQRSILWSWFPPIFTWVPGIELRPSGWSMCL